MRNLSVTLWFVLCCMCLAVVPAKAVELAFEGSAGRVAWDPAQWTVVIPEDAIPSEQYAAEEFQRWFEAYAGVKLAVTTQCPKPTHNIFIGPGEAMAASSAAVKTEDLGEEDVRLRVTPDNIAIVGGRPRGTLYAVYEFLERYLGVRFLTFDHTHVPNPSGTVVVPCEEFTFRPTFSFRWSYYGENREQPAFAAKLRCNTVTHDERLGGVTPQSLIGHSFSRQLPQATYAKDHPEYFALVNGKRVKAGNWDGPQPCCTNPDVIEIITNSVLAELRANPSRRNISVSINDHYDFCECEQCAELDEKEETNGASTLYLVNAVADAIKEEFPDTFVGTLAYYYTRKPPKHMKPRDNVQLQLCSIECCVTKPIEDPGSEENRAFHKALLDWAEISDNIWIWNYNTNFHYYDMPCANLRVIGPNVRLFARNNVKGVFMQANGNGFSGEMSDLRNYVISRTLWNPEEETWPLVEEFCRLHYKEAAQPILDHLEYIHDVAAASGYEPNCFGDPIAFGITKEVAAKIYAYFAEALALAQDPVVRARVERASICAYRAVLQVCGESVIEGGRARLVYPVPYEGVFERYKQLCTQYDMRRAAEHYGRDDYINLVQKRMDGVGFLSIENETWEATCMPEANGSVTLIRHKPSGRQFGSSYEDMFNVDYGFPPEVVNVRRRIEEWGMQGIAKHQADFDVQSDGESITLSKAFEDGSTLTREVSLEGDTIRFATNLTHKGEAPKTYQLMFHPEWDVGTTCPDGDIIRAYVLDDGAYTWFNRKWKKDAGPDKNLLASATGGALAFFNREDGFGIRQAYDATSGLEPRLWWGAEDMHLNLELWTPEVELKQGKSYSYFVDCEYLTEPPDAEK